MVCGGELVAVGVRDVVFELRGRRKGLFAGLVWVYAACNCPICVAVIRRFVLAMALIGIPTAMLICIVGGGVRVDVVFRVCLDTVSWLRWLTSRCAITRRPSWTKRLQRLLIASIWHVVLTWALATVFIRARCIRRLTAARWRLVRRWWINVVGALVVAEICCVKLAVVFAGFRYWPLP